MNRSRSQNMLLVEILIALLFFVLCTAVLISTFAAARELSRRSETDNAAIVEVQNIADRMYAAEDAEALIAAEGFAASGDSWIREESGLRIEISIKEENNTTGMIKTADICAYDGERLIARLPFARYRAGEGTL